MDPDANLEEQREIAARIRAWDELDHWSKRDNWQDLERDAARLVELVESLNVWLARGGALPKAWTRT